MAFWNRKSSNPNNQPVPSTATPIRGDIKPKSAITITTLKTKEIVFAVVGGIIVIAIVFYFIIAGLGINSNSSKQNVNKASAAKAPPISIPKPTTNTDNALLDATHNKSKKIKTPKTDYKTKTPKTPKMDNNNQPPENKAKSAQTKAFLTAMKGSNFVSWSKPSSSATNAYKKNTNNNNLNNNQTENNKKRHSVYSYNLVHKEISQFELLQGTVIPAVLETGIKSDISGQVTGIVTHPVYNSASGAFVLIPAGSKIIGNYSNRIIAGDTRVAVAWTRVIFPNGTYLNLDNGMPAAGPSGYAGLHDHVDNHTWSIFRSALLFSIIDAGMALASPQQSTDSNGTITGNVALTTAEQSLAQTFGQAEAQLLEREINIAPTLTIPTGFPLNVVITKDLIFPGPYKKGFYMKNQSVLPVSMPTIAEPYKGA